MRSALCLAVLSAVLASAQALYSAGGPVVVLEQSNFKSKLKDGIWMVEFYAPWYVLPGWPLLPAGSKCARCVEACGNAAATVAC